MDSIRKRVKTFIIRNRMLDPGDLVLVGLSGGPDSVFLLYILKELSGELGISVSAMHVHHGIRGAEADRDLAFARELAQRMEIPFREQRVDAPSWSAASGQSLEEAARELRYRALREAKLRQQELSGRRVRIAVAHHMDDQAETVLHNLVRGSGLRGLAGMGAVHEDVIRPLLCLTRAEILEALTAAGLTYVTDSTNQDLAYTRNRIRAAVLPELKAINAQAVQHIARTAELLRESDAYFLQIARDYVDHKSSIGVPEDGTLREISVSLESLREQAPIVRKYILAELVHRLKTPLKDWGSVHFEDMDALLFRQGGAHLDLPYHMSADIRKKRLIIRVNREIISMKRRKKS